MELIDFGNRKKKRGMSAWDDAKNRRIDLFWDR